jgi:exopolyphosphatase/guanosine-5'-triphosphate,3'-diphosphate pyrophosphatase
VADGRLARLWNESEWLGLGEVVTREGSVPAYLVQRLCKTLARFRATATARGATGMYVFATEAVRRAEGGDKLAQAASRSAGVPVDVIAPEREAALGLRGALLDSPGETPGLFAECGGGSVQLAMFCEEGIEWDESLPLGTGALRARLGLTQPATRSQVREVRRIVREALPEPARLEKAKRLVASGGVARGLVRALHPDGDQCLQRLELEYLAWACPQLTAQQIQERFRVKQQRAATLVAGSIVFLETLRAARLDSVRVSEFGVREGAVLQMSEQGVGAWRL